MGLPPVTFCLELACYLAPFTYLKERNLDLFEVLRRKAIAWCQSHEMLEVDVQRVLLGSVIMAMIKTDEEKAAIQLLSHRLEESGQARYWILDRVFAFFGV